MNWTWKFGTDASRCVSASESGVYALS